MLRLSFGKYLARPQAPENNQPLACTAANGILKPVPWSLPDRTESPAFQPLSIALVALLTHNLLLKLSRRARMACPE